VKTLAEMLLDHEESAFVGRDPELAAFRTWLDAGADGTPVWNVTGRGGIGKTALLRAYQRAAVAAGRAVRHVDARELRPRPADLLAALGGDTPEDVAAELARTSAVVLIDSFEYVLPLTRFIFETFLPALPVGARVVIASRSPVLDVSRRQWGPLTRRVELRGLSTTEARRYLARRGLVEDAATEWVLAAASGHPLSLSLAGDLAASLSDGDLRLDTPTDLDWPDTVTVIAHQFLRDVHDPVLREFLEIATIVRQVDEELLAAVAGREQVAADFRSLSRLSVMRPTTHGAALHDDVRRVLGRDLRRRAPDRYHELRARVFEHQRGRLEEARLPEDRARAFIEMFFLMERSVVQAMMFADRADPGEIVLSDAGPGDDDVVLGIERVWHEEVLPDLGMEPVRETWDQCGSHLGSFVTFVRHPDARVRIARTTDGEAVGFSLIMPVARSSHEILRTHWFTGPTTRAFVEREGGAGQLAADAVSTQVHQGIQLATIGEHADAARAALFQDLFELISGGGALLIAAVLPEHLALLESLGFETLPGSEVADVYGNGDTVMGGRGLLLDLRGTNVERWVAGRVLPLRIPEGSGSGPAPTDVTGAPAPRARIRVLGGFAVETDDRGAPCRLAGVGAMLVRYLATTGGRAHIEVVSEVLWPGVDPPRCRVRLRNVLARIRTACGGIIERDGDRLTLAADVLVDAQVFEELARAALAATTEAGALARRALVHYRGELLPADPYEAWADGPRRRLARLRADLLRALMDASAAAHDVDEAIRLGERLIDAEPHDEAHYVRLVRVMLADGRTGAARQVIVRAREALSELGVRPSRHLEELEGRVFASG
jgi:DNA-binding SARP family transcriptional activator